MQARRLGVLAVAIGLLAACGKEVPFEGSARVLGETLVIDIHTENPGAVATIEVLGESFKKTSYDSIGKTIEVPSSKLPEGATTVEVRISKTVQQLDVQVEPFLMGETEEGATPPSPWRMKLSAEGLGETTYASMVHFSTSMGGRGIPKTKGELGGGPTLWNVRAARLNGFPLPVEDLHVVLEPDLLVLLHDQPVTLLERPGNDPMRIQGRLEVEPWRGETRSYDLQFEFQTESAVVDTLAHQLVAMGTESRVIPGWPGKSATALVVPRRGTMGDVALFGARAETFGDVGYLAWLDDEKGERREVATCRYHGPSLPLVVRDGTVSIRTLAGSEVLASPSYRAKRRGTCPKTVASGSKQLFQQMYTEDARGQVETFLRGR